MEPKPSDQNVGHQLASFISAVVLLGLLVAAISTCSDADLVVPGNIPPTLINTPVATATPIGV